MSIFCWLTGTGVGLGVSAPGVAGKLGVTAGVPGAPVAGAAVVDVSSVEKPTGGVPPVMAPVAGSWVMPV